MDRAVRFAPAFRNFSHTHRVLAFNVFILSKLSYLLNFFNIPVTDRRLSCAVGVIEKAARTLIIRSKTAYHYFHLVGPGSIASP